MDTKTGQIFNFKDEVDLLMAKEKNPNLKEMSNECICIGEDKTRECMFYRELRKVKDDNPDNYKSFCVANRKQRRKFKCFAKEKEV